MKSFIVLALCVAVAVANQADKSATITKYESENIGVDGYAYHLQTSNDINAEEQGVLKNAGTEAEAIEVSGKFSYVGDDGITYTVNYVANENGFQPQGAHLPVAP